MYHNADAESEALHKMDSLAAAVAKAADWRSHFYDGDTDFWSWYDEDWAWKEVVHLTETTMY